MSNTQNFIPPVQYSGDPDLTYLLSILKKEIMLDTNCHALGTIQSFDATKQTAQITINYNRSYINPDNTLSFEPYPLLVDCPVVFMFGGNGRLTMPITTGDTCVVLFNDRDIDNWFTTGNVTLPNTSRLHSLSDGIAIVGLRSLGNKLSNYSSTAVQLYNDTCGISLSTKIKLENDVTTLKNVITGLIDVIKGLTTTNAVVGAPCAVSVASQASLESYKSTVGNLLE